MRTSKLLFAISLAAFILVSCQQEKNPISTDDLNMAEDEAVAEAMFDDVFSSVDNVVQAFDIFMKGEEVKGEGIYILCDSCPLVTVDITNQNVKIITIDYGDGCEGFYDKVRSGKILIELNGHRREVGSSRTVTFENYFFNGIKLEGVKHTENLGPNDNENVVFLSTLTDGKMVFPNDTIVEREFTRYREWIAGYNTWNIWDDECLVTGDVSGKSYKGVSYQNTIIAPLHWKRVCRFFVSGIIKIERDGIEPFELDYGDGECDATAVLRRGDEEKEITLGFKHRKIN